MPALERAPTREYVTATMDSRRWAGFQPRADDIIVATYPKCGTTWTQRIVDLLVFQSSDSRQFLANSPWIDATFFAPIEVNLATVEAQTHRRYVKSHLPFDALPVFDGVKYIHVVRDGRDACMSMHNHMLGFKPEMRARIMAGAPPDHALSERHAGTPEDPREFYLQWITEAEADNERGDLSFFNFENTYWAERKRPNLLFVHYNDLKADLAGEVRRISDYLEIDTPQSLLPALVEAARFETMKAHGEEMMPQLNMAFDRGADRFINKGTNGRWREALTADDLARYHAMVERKFSPAEARWIEHGRGVAGDPREL
jgi:aryl sulfotransferase